VAKCNLCPASTSPETAQMVEAAVTPQVAARMRARAAISLRTDRSGRVRATGSVKIEAASQLIERAAVNVTNTDARNILSGVAAVMATASIRLRDGQPPELVLGAGAGLTLGTWDTALAVSALTSARNEIAVNASLRASYRLVDKLLELTVRANERGLSWGLGVELPFLQYVTFRGLYRWQAGGNVRTELTLGWAWRQQIRLGGNSQ